MKRLEERFPEWHPVIQMAEIANDESLTLMERFNAAKEVAPYVTHKLKTIEHTGEDGGPIQVVMGKDDAKL